MFNLDEVYHTYLHSDKRFRIDGVGEKVVAYGYRCDGSDIIGHTMLQQRIISCIMI